MGKYFSKKRMEPKLWKIGRDFNLATHVGLDLFGNIYVYSRDPVHFPNGYYLPDGIGEMQKIGDLGRTCNDWEKYKWEIRRDEKQVKELDISLLRALNPEVTDSGCISWDNFIHRRFEGEWNEAETGPEIKDLEPSGKLFYSRGGESTSDSIKSDAEYIDDFVDNLSPECWAAIARRVLEDNRMNKVEEAAPKESWQEIAGRLGIPYIEPQIQITEEQTPEDAALEVLEKFAVVFKEYFGSVLPVLKGIYEIMEAEKARHEDFAVEPVKIQLQDTEEEPTTPRIVIREEYRLSTGFNEEPEQVAVHEQITTDNDTDARECELAGSGVVTMATKNNIPEWVEGQATRVSEMIFIRMQDLRSDIYDDVNSEALKKIMSRCADYLLGYTNGTRLMEYVKGILMEPGAMTDE